MRKFFAATLAAAMTLSMAAVSFAANDYAGMAIAGPYRYDSDKNVMIDVEKGEKNDTIRYGGTAHYLIKIHDATSEGAVDPDNAKAISSYKEVEKLKIKAEFEMGEDLVESVSLVKKYVDADEYVSGTTKYAIVTDSHITASDYYYFVEFKLASKQVTYDSDVVGTLEFNRKADDDVKSTSAGSMGIGKIKDWEEDFEFNVFYKNTYLGTNRTDLKITGDVEDLEYDTDYALKFDCDDEVELSFGANNDGNNEGTFTVDVSGQGKVFLNYNTKANEAIAAANPGVKMFFLNFNNVKFNRVGEFVYEMDDIVAAYKVVDGQLVEINGLELDSDSATFNTRTLESYVFADAELVNPTVEVEAPVVNAPVVEAPVTNPSTGANA